jgi:ABC-type Mn2+/Zn2+ transport system permease subunit
VSDFLDALANHAFLQIALVGGLLASIACGVMGAYVVVRRMSFIAGGIAHTVLSGMGVAYYFGRSPVAGAIVAALISAWVIGWVSLRWSQSADTIIAALWSVGMAVGVVFIARTPGYNVDLMSYLFGNILMVPRADLLTMAALDAVIVLIRWWASFWSLHCSLCRPPSLRSSCRDWSIILATGLEVCERGIGCPMVGSRRRSRAWSQEWHVGPFAAVALAARAKA